MEMRPENGEKTPFGSHLQACNRCLCTLCARQESCPVYWPKFIERKIGLVVRRYPANRCTQKCGTRESSTHHGYVPLEALGERKIKKGGFVERDESGVLERGHLRCEHFQAMPALTEHKPAQVSVQGRRALP